MTYVLKVGDSQAEETLSDPDAVVEAVECLEALSPGTNP
jgi:hypothetical protein